MGNEDNLLIVDKKGYIATLVFNNPEKRNAFSPDLLIEIYKTLREFSQTDDVRCVILRGSGETSFSSGYDIGAIPTKVTPEIRSVLEKQNPLELVLSCVKEFQYPTIAMLNGYAFGAGFNMSMCCDIRIAADDIRMGMPPAKLGLIYHPEGIQQFIETLGMAKTREIFMTGRNYTGKELLDRGIVDYLVPRAELESFTNDYAEKITENAPLSLKGMKKIINMFGAKQNLDEIQMKKAKEIVAVCFQSDDLKEGQTAFLQKRKPNFTGR